MSDLAVLKKSMYMYGWHRITTKAILLDNTGHGHQHCNCVLISPSFAWNVYLINLFCFIVFTFTPTRKSWHLLIMLADWFIIGINALMFQEKWDSMTRKWRDNHSLVQLVKLFLIDEVSSLFNWRRKKLNISTNCYS